MDTYRYLSRVFLFESLADNQLESIENAITVDELNAGDILFSDGQKAIAFYILITGTVKIYKLSSEGSEQILHIQNPGDLIAEAVIFEFDYYPAFCQALEKSVLLRVNKQEFLQLLEKYPAITFKIMSAYSRRIRQLVNKIEELTFRDVKARVANYILRNSTIRENQEVCPLILTKKNLAAVLGTIPETLSRTLNFFKKENIIREENNYIFILDKVRLKDFKE